MENFEEELAFLFEATGSSCPSPVHDLDHPITHSDPTTISDPVPSRVHSLPQDIHEELCHDVQSIPSIHSLPSDIHSDPLSSDHAHDFPEFIFQIKNKLSSLRVINSFTNDDLAIVHDNIHMFTDEELLCLPNVQSMGYTHYFVKESIEIMMVLKSMVASFNLPIKDVIKPYLKHRNLCHCGKERRHGFYFCTLHKHAMKKNL